MFAPLLGRLRLVLGGGITLGQVAERTAAAYGRRTLVDEEGWAPTHDDAADMVDAWASALATRVAPGERVVLAMPNGHRQLLATLAVARAGAIAVPVNPQMRPVEIDHVVADAGAALTIRSYEDLEQPERRRTTGRSDRPVSSPSGPEDVAALFYTSGTTGKPKGVQLSHRALIGSARLGALNLLPGPTAVMALPIAHIMGFTVGLGLALAGVPVAALTRFDPVAVLDLIEERRAQVFIGVPAMYRMLLEAGAEARDLRSIRMWMSGADVMPPDLAETFQALGATAGLPGLGAVGKAAFVEGYGLAESAGVLAIKARLPLPGPVAALAERVLPGDAVGLPVPGVSLRIRDGELEAKGRGITSGYWGDAAASAAALTDDGWLRTGDRAAPGPLGSVRFQGRSKDVIKVGGYSVYAVEVEAALAAHPDVLEAAVVALPDERLGEVPVAVVRLSPAAGRSHARGRDLDALLAGAVEALAPYKRPRRIVAVEELPRTGTGKVQKERLRTLFR